MYLKVHDTPTGKIVAVCDKELIGKVLDDGKIFMDLDKNRSFFVGKIASKEEIKKELSSFSSLNFVGKNSIDLLLDLNLVDSSSVEKVSNVPFVQIYDL